MFRKCESPRKVRLGKSRKWRHSGKKSTVVDAMDNLTFYEMIIGEMARHYGTVPRDRWKAEGWRSRLGKFRPRWETESATKADLSKAAKASSFDLALILSLKMLLRKVLSGFKGLARWLSSNQTFHFVLFPAASSSENCTSDKGSNVCAAIHLFFCAVNTSPVQLNGYKSLKWARIKQLVKLMSSRSLVRLP